MATPTILRDGSTALLRPLEPDDKPLIAQIWLDMSELSRRRRFLAPTREPNAEDLEYLTSVDHNRHEAVIALEEETGRPLGVARYVRVPGDREAAEAAVVVIDDWHGRGLGTELMNALTERARANGIRRYVAYVSEDNEIVIGAIERAGAARIGPAEDDEIELEFELPSEGLGERLRAALRAAAGAPSEFLAMAFRRLPVWRRRA